MNRSQGSTTLSVLIASALILLITASVISSYYRYYKKVNVELLNQRVGVVIDSLNYFYNANCFTGANPAPNGAGLVALGMLDSIDTLDNPFGGVLTPDISWGNPSMIEVSATFTAENLQQMINVLNPSSVVATTLTWSTVPEMFSDQSNGELLIYRSMYMSECF